MRAPSATQNISALADRHQIRLNTCLPSFWMSDFMVFGDPVLMSMVAAMFNKETNEIGIMTPNSAYGSVISMIASIILILIS
jgi:hypothetical protein